jgi:hypothetical protein
MEVVENLKQWQQEFEEGWLAHLRATGQTDFSRYAKIKNTTAPAGRAIDLSQSRLMLITTAGTYLKESQEPFDAPNPLGDYSIRTYPLSTPFEALAVAHNHYDHTAINQDPQVLLPMQHLADMVNEGKIGALASAVVSFSGYQPDVARVVYELIPEIIRVVKAQEIDAALLVPA